MGIFRVPYQTSKKRHRLRCIQRIINITKKAGKVEGSIGSAQNQKIERAIRVYSQYPKDRVITAIDKKKGLTVEEKQIVLERLQIDSRNMQASQAPRRHGRWSCNQPSHDTTSKGRNTTVVKHLFRIQRARWLDDERCLDNNTLWSSTCFHQRVRSTHPTTASNFLHL